MGDGDGERAIMGDGDGERAIIGDGDGERAIMGDGEGERGVRTDQLVVRVSWRAEDGALLGRRLSGLCSRLKLLVAARASARAYSI